MSRQCRFYLLPSDIERLLNELRPRVAFSLISGRSSAIRPIELIAPFSEYVLEQTKTKFFYVNCYMTPQAGSEVKMEYLPKQGQWAVSESSEVVQFSGCDYDGKTLTVGRLYFRTDQLIGDALWPKRPEFLRWAERILQITRRLLEHSRTLNAYVGKDAAEWERNGGRFKAI